MFKNIVIIVLAIGVLGLMMPGVANELQFGIKEVLASLRNKLNRIFKKNDKPKS